MNNKILPVTFSYQDHAGNQHDEVHEVALPEVYRPFPFTSPDSTVNRPEPGHWSLLAGRADEWFASHLILGAESGSLKVLSPWLFAAGHAIELYLKAAVASVTDLKTAVDFKH
jgi:hypothetical protein